MVDAQPTATSGDVPAGGRMCAFIPGRDRMRWRLERDVLRPGDPTLSAEGTAWISVRQPVSPALQIDPRAGRASRAAAPWRARVHSQGGRPDACPWHLMRSWAAGRTQPYCGGSAPTPSSVFLADAKVSSLLPPGCSPLVPGPYCRKEQCETVTNLEPTDHIISQGPALVRAIQAIETIEPSDDSERVSARLLVKPYRRRLRAIIDTVPA